MLYVCIYIYIYIYIHIAIYTYTRIRIDLYLLSTVMFGTGRVGKPLHLHSCRGLSCVVKGLARVFKGSFSIVVPALRIQRSYATNQFSTLRLSDAKHYAGVHLDSASSPLTGKIFLQSNISKVVDLSTKDGFGCPTPALVSRSHLCARDRPHSRVLSK